MRINWRWLTLIFWRVLSEEIGARAGVKCNIVTGRSKNYLDKQNEVLMHTCTKLRSLSGIQFCVLSFVGTFCLRKLASPLTPYGFSSLIFSGTHFQWSFYTENDWLNMIFLASIIVSGHTLGHFIPLDIFKKCQIWPTCDKINAYTLHPYTIL